MCSTHNVTASTQMIVTEEFKKGGCTPLLILLSYNCVGADIVDKVIVGTASWSELFQKHDFFHKYRYYLQVIASTADADMQIKWYESPWFHWFWKSASHLQGRNCRVSDTAAGYEA